MEQRNNGLSGKSLCVDSYNKRKLKRGNGSCVSGVENVLSRVFFMIEGCRKVTDWTANFGGVRQKVDENITIKEDGKR